jgi:hypothetical protein
VEQGIEKGEKSFPYHEEFMEKMKSFLDTLMDQPFCFDLDKTTRETTCQCLHKLHAVLTEEEKIAACEELIDFAKRERTYQQGLMSAWQDIASIMHHHFPKQHREFMRLFYAFPGYKSGDGPYLICKNALAKLYGFGRDAWRNVLKFNKRGKEPFHVRPCHKPNNDNALMQEDLQDFFEKVKDLAQPKAARLVQSLVGHDVEVKMHDEDPDVKVLPRHMTKRGLYTSFCEQRGWKVKYDPKNQILPSEKILDFDGQHKPIPGWTTFLRFWKEKYPKIIIEKASENVYGESFVANQARRLALRKKRKSPEDDGEEADANNEGEDPVPAKEEVAAEEEAMLKSEVLVEKAAEHVKECCKPSPGDGNAKSPPCKKKPKLQREVQTSFLLKI